MIGYLVRENVSRAGARNHRFDKVENRLRVNTGCRMERNRTDSESTIYKTFLKNIVWCSPAAVGNNRGRTLATYEGHMFHG